MTQDTQQRSTPDDGHHKNQSGQTHGKGGVVHEGTSKAATMRSMRIPWEPLTRTTSLSVRVLLQWEMASSVFSNSMIFPIGMPAQRAASAIRCPSVPIVTSVSALRRPAHPRSRAPAFLILPLVRAYAHISTCDYQFGNRLSACQHRSGEALSVIQHQCTAFGFGQPVRRNCVCPWRRPSMISRSGVGQAQPPLRVKLYGRNAVRSWDVNCRVSCR